MVIGQDVHLTELEIVLQGFEAEGGHIRFELKFVAIGHKRADVID